jgi:phosphate-selective porin OprO/OprP
MNTGESSRPYWGQHHSLHKKFSIFGGKMSDLQTFICEIRRPIFVVLCTSFCLFILPVTIFSASVPLPFESSDVDSSRRLEELEAQVKQLQEIVRTEQVSTRTTSSSDFAGDAVNHPHDVDRCFSCTGTDDGFPTVSVTGFLHADLVIFNQDELNRTTIGDLENGADLRRARVGFKGDLTQEISYILEFDFGESISLFVDNWVNFSDVPGLGNIRIGRWRQPFGMTELTSVKELPFLERPTIFTFAPFRQTGIGFANQSLDERATWALSAYRFPSDNFGGNVGDSGGWGFAGRVTLLAFDDSSDAQRIHLGGNYSFHDPSDDTMRFSSQPEIQVTESTGGLLPTPQDGVPPFVDTGVMSVLR